MSNLLKSKTLYGAMIVGVVFAVVMLVGAFALTANAAYVHTVTLKQGSSGPQVVALQSTLSGLISDGVFGPRTASAVMAFQTSKGLTADGIVGPMTGAALSGMVSGGGTLPAGCSSSSGFSVTTGLPCSGGSSLPAGCMPGYLFSSTTGMSCTGGSTPTTPGPLQGTEGDLEFNVMLDSNVVIDLGDSETVIEVEAEAIDGDVSIDRVDFYFSDRPWLYFSEVNLMVGGKEVKSLSGSSDFSSVSGDYRARFSGLNEIVREDKTVVIGLELKVLASMAGSRDEETVEVSMQDNSIRFTDGSGAIFTTSASELDISVDVEFDENFGNGDVEVSLADNSPDNQTFLLDEDNRTNGVTVLIFEVEATDSDMNVQDVTVDFETNEDSVSATLYRAYLYQGSTLLKSKSVSGDSVIFDDLDIMIDEDDTETFTVKVDFNKTDGLTIDEFTVVEVEVTAENEDFQLESDTLNVDETHQLVTEGLVDMFTSRSASTSALGDDTIGKLTFKFDLTAYEDDFFIAEDGDDFNVTLDNEDMSVLSVTIATTNATIVGDSYRISKGQTRSFTVEIQVSSDAGTKSGRATIADLTYWTNSDMDEGEATLNMGSPDYRSTSVTVQKAS